MENDLLELKQNPEKAVSAAFDSVELINELVSQPVDDDKKSIVKRNVEHLVVMLTKEFFTNTLTAEQKTEIDTCISSGNSYVG
jgi:hypothetical protein